MIETGQGERIMETDNQWVWKDRNQLKREIEQLRAIVDAFLEFSISPTFDAKGSYTTRKSRELAQIQDLARDQLQLHGDD